MSDHTYAQEPSTPSTSPNREDPQCDSCFAKRSEVGGTFYAWESANGNQAVYCEVCHSGLRAVAAREEQIARAVAPGIAMLRRHWSLSLKDILEALGEFRDIDENRLELMMNGGSEDICRPVKDDGASRSRDADSN